MSHIIADRVCETTTTTGTSTLTLAGAKTGFRAFSVVCANNDTAMYTVSSSGGAEWEEGIGTWLTGNSLARTTVLFSSNANAAVSFSAGTKDVYIADPAQMSGAVQTGATVPANPVEGMAFLHAPTGRTVFLRYGGGTWRAEHSYGTMAIFVDGASGADTINKGTGTGANAYATIQYAINSLPGSYAGNITISIAAGTYAENVTIQGKVPTGAYTITLTGTRTNLDSLTSSASTQGSGATQGTAVRNAGTWTSNQRQNKMVRFTAGVNSGVTRLIDSNSTTTITIVEVWSGGAPGTDTFVVEDWGTVIQSVNVATAQINVYLVDISLVSVAGSPSLVVGHGATINLSTCSVSVAAGATTFGVTDISGVTTFDTTFLTNATEGDRILACGSQSTVIVTRSKVLSNDNSTLYAVIAQSAAQILLQNGTVVDANAGAYGIELEASSILGCFTGNAHHRVRNAGTTGINVTTGAGASFTGSGVYIEYSGNLANTAADAATYSSIS